MEKFLKCNQKNHYRKEQGVNSQAIMMVPLTTVSNGRGLHLLLGRDDVVRTFAVGFWYMSKNNNDNNSSNNNIIIIMIIIMIIIIMIIIMMIIIFLSCHECRKKNPHEESNLK